MTLAMRHTCFMTHTSRFNLVRDVALDSKLEALASYAERNEIKTDAALLREMIDAGYDALRRRELREALAANAKYQNDSIADEAAILNAADLED